MKLKCPKCQSPIYVDGRVNVGHDNEIEVEEYATCTKCDWYAEVKDFVWITRDKQVMTFKDITDEHLTNILIYLQKKAKIEYDADVATFYALGEPRGDMAQLAWDEEERYLLEEQSPLDYLARDVYNPMYEEFERRKLENDKVGNFWYLKE